MNKKILYDNDSYRKEFCEGVHKIFRNTQAQGYEQEQQIIDLFDSTPIAGEDIEPLSPIDASISRTQSDAEYRKELLDKADKIVQHIMQQCEHFGVCEGCNLHEHKDVRGDICLWNRAAADLINLLLCESNRKQGPPEKVSPVLLFVDSPPNDPLTLEELRELGKDWVWIASLIPNYVVVTGYYVKYPDFYSDGILIGYPGHMSRYLEYAQYGRTWLAYRRKPEEVQR